MLTSEQAKKALHYVLPIFIAVVSICILAKVIPASSFIQTTLSSLESSKEKVMDLSGATLGASVGLSALPDDFASPLANSFADLMKYYIFIFAVLFVENLIVVEGTRIALVYIVPAACVIYMIGRFFQKEFIREFAMKLAVLACALVLAVPVSTHFTDAICSQYLASIDATIEQTETQVEQTDNDTQTSKEDQGIKDKLNALYDSATSAVGDLVAKFKVMLKDCIQAIAILIVTTFVMPILTLLFFKWLLQELFQFSFQNRSLIQLLSKNKGEKENEE